MLQPRNFKLTSCTFGYSRFELTWRPNKLLAYVICDLEHREEVTDAETEAHYEWLLLGITA